MILLESYNGKSQKRNAAEKGKKKADILQKKRVQQDKKGIVKKETEQLTAKEKPKI